MQEMNKKPDTETCTNPGKSFQQQDCWKKQQKILMKTMEDSKYNIFTALAWAVSAKTALQKCEWLLTKLSGIWKECKSSFYVDRQASCT